MKDTAKKKSMTYEEALKDSSLTEYHEAIRAISNKPFSQLFPKKHELSLIDVVGMNTIVLFKKSPYLPIKLVITTIFEPLTNDIPAPLMLKLTEKIIEQWESLSATAAQETQIAIAA
jgi:hypothetical protein